MSSIFPILVPPYSGASNDFLQVILIDNESIKSFLIGIIEYFKGSISMLKLLFFR